jgi:thiamine-phosphate pyrophosphorylase
MNETSPETLRIVDANINRLGEGLRVLEEFARLTLNQKGLTQRLKDLRHQLLRQDYNLQIRLLDARKADSDVGSDMEVTGEEKSKDVSTLVLANSHRVQESLRVIEELAKSPGLSLDSEIFRQARFALYTIEKDLVAAVTRREKAQKIKGLYLVIDYDWLKGRSVIAVAEDAIKGGVKIIQLRCKTAKIKEFLTMADRLRKICAGHDVLFIVNDSLEVALAVNADGLHIGQEDLPVSTARQLLPIDMLLGVSVATVAESKAALEDGADYLGVSAIYSTATKDSKALGVKRITEIKNAVDLPLVAIGGINQDNLKDIIGAGTDSAAVISAVMGAPDITRAARMLVNMFGEHEYE